MNNRAAIVRALDALDALEDGDAGYTLELLRALVDDQEHDDAGRCLQCDRWPGERWTCSRCALEEAA